MKSNGRKGLVDLWDAAACATTITLHLSGLGWHEFFFFFQFLLFIMSYRLYISYIHMYTLFLQDLLKIFTA